MILPSFVAAKRQLVDDVAAVDRRDVVLRTLLRPLHRAAEPLRERDRERLLRVDVQLRAEAAADVGGDDADLRLGDSEDELQREAQDVRHLRRRPERDLAGRADLREDAARLHRVRDQPWLEVAARDDDVGRVDRRLDVVRLELPDVALVRPEVRVDERRAVLERLLDVRDGRERLVVDLDELRRVLRERAALRDDDRDAVALDSAPRRSASGKCGGILMSSVTGQAHGSAPFQSSCEVGSAERGDDTFGAAGGIEVHAPDARVRVRAADDDHADRAGQSHVVDEVPAAAEQRRVLLALDRGADESGSGLGRRPSTPPPRRPAPP